MSKRETPLTRRYWNLVPACRMRNNAQREAVALDWREALMLRNEELVDTAIAEGLRLCQGIRTAE